MLVVASIGFISIAVAVFSIFNGQTFADNWWGIFLGVTLIGVAWIEIQKE